MGLTLALLPHRHPSLPRPSQAHAKELEVAGNYVDAAAALAQAADSSDRLSDSALGDSEHVCACVPPTTRRLARRC
jgi:hypothetical protein